ncbi:MAG: TRAP transporter small permease [Deltaproteobacteria bacterium]|nr:TRAP transporter small permease [Deltaproteobacteria bacterium]
MNSFNNYTAIIHSFSNRLEKALIFICAACLIAGVLGMLAEVSCRYVRGISITWAEELVRFVNIWFIFLFVGPLAKRGAHLNVTALYSRFSPGIRKSLTVFFSLLNIAVCGLLAWWGIRLTHLMLQMGVKSMTGSILHPWTWRLSIPVSMLIAVFFLVENLIFHLKDRGE